MTAVDRDIRTQGILVLLMWFSLTPGLIFTFGCQAQLGPGGAEEVDGARREASERGATAGVPGSSAERTRARRGRLEVVGEYPHDPGAFTQGLLWHDGMLYESTGRYGESTLRLVEPRTGAVLRMQSLSPSLFGEGLALVDGQLIQLTWRAGRALVWDLERFEPIDEWGYNGQGWGLTAGDGELIMSDGSTRLTFRDPVDFSWRRTLEVSLDGRPLPQLNELEYVDGKVWANVWSDQRLVRIDLTTGAVDLVVDASGLLDPDLARYVDVLNGIAHDPETGHFWVTGKLWPRIFEVRITAPDE
ncbi:MAG: glutaminyl-peptide cyclotransferase [Acidobacteriota bacterium]